MRIRSKDVNSLKIVFLTKRIVIHIVSRSNLQATGTEVYFHVTVFDDRNYTAHFRHDYVLAAKPVILRVFGVDTHGHVAHDCLRTRCGYDSVIPFLVFVNHLTLFTGRCNFRLLLHIILEIEQVRMLIVIDYLFVRESRLALRVPIDHTQTAIDESFAIEVAEHVNHGTRARFVHRKGCTVPITGATKGTKLFEDDSSVLIGPSPSVLQELFACKVAFAYSLLSEPFDDFGFCGDGGMVRTRHPAGILPFLTCTTNENVLNSFIQDVPHVEHASHVGRRNHDRKRFPAIRLRVKQFIIKPVLIPFGFDVGRIVFSIHRLVAEFVYDVIVLSLHTRFVVETIVEGLKRTHIIGILRINFVCLFKERK